ncbi:MAG TPA: hypothetical protein DD381_13735 [Lentisphaeria bacterium]|nr:MAG: hypothetical protein A2X47_13795 [Lentisphaerae bacterium GWF2_38_69]HBM17383.1 hypothetical protein [Lentisphaeria bacterium]
MKYLLCPKCAVHRFFVKSGDKNIYFHVAFNGSLIPTAQSNADLSSVNTEEISCSGCSWSGNSARLVNFF